MSKKPKAQVSPEQAIYDAANAAYQDSWKRLGKHQERYRKAKAAYLGLPIETWGLLNMIRHAFGKPVPALVEFYAAKDALEQAEGAATMFLAQWETAYKALVASQAPKAI
jgi:hypothetical protein